MMKHKIILTILASFFFLSFGQTFPLDASLQKPECADTTGMGLLLSENKVHDFYAEVSAFLKQVIEHRNSGEEVPGKGYQCRVLWALYYLANTPLIIPGDSYEESDWIKQTKNLDYKVKERAIRILTLKRYDRYFDQGNKADMLRVRYSAMILKDFFSQTQLSTFTDDYEKLGNELDQDREKRFQQFIKETREEYQRQLEKNPRIDQSQEWVKKWYEDIQHRENSMRVPFILRGNRLVTLSGRNSMLKHILREDNRLEPSFVEMLVRFFPNKAGEVRKYIKEAGYKEDEIGDLIDRTVGRTPKTEFLYKGSHGRAHDKKVAKPRK